MTRSRWIIVVLVLLALDLGATIHAHQTFHRKPGGPSVMPVGQLLGWASSVLLAIVLVALLIHVWRNPRRVPHPRLDLDAEQLRAAGVRWPEDRPGRG